MQKLPERLEIVVSPAHDSYRQGPEAHLARGYQEEARGDMNRRLVVRDDREFPHNRRRPLRERQLARRPPRLSADGRARGDRRDGAVLRPVASADGTGLAPGAGRKGEEASRLRDVAA